MRVEQKWCASWKFVLASFFVPLILKTFTLSCWNNFSIWIKKNRSFKIHDRIRATKEQNLFSCLALCQSAVYWLRIHLHYLVHPIKHTCVDDYTNYKKKKITNIDRHIVTWQTQIPVTGLDLSNNNVIYKHCLVTKCVNI